ncbi:MAG: PAAR-like domain-containing protein, partial [Paracoccus sp. (in: a-proteobacteria)]
MPSHIIVNGLGLTYKSTLGLSTATIPDVCKTPSPAGPVPIPYPNFASQATLKS